MVSPLSESRLQRAEYYFSEYAVVLPDGVSLDDALKPEYWVHVTKRLRQHDSIRIVPEDGSFFAEALVLSAGTGFARLKLLRQVSLEEDGEPIAATDPAFAKYFGPHDKWCVVRRSDNSKLHKGLPTKLDAEKAAAAYNAKVG